MAQKYYYLDFEGLSRYDAIVEQKIADAIGEVAHFRVEVVDELPTKGEIHVLYLKHVGGTGSDECDEYLWVEDESAAGGHWELIGSTRIDLSEYAKIVDVDASLAEKVDNSSFQEFQTYVNTELGLKADKSEVDASLAEKQDVINDLAEIRSGAELGATALQSIPAEYITESELDASLANYATNAVLENYATNASLAEKQNVINDLNEIREGAALGATALQSFTETDPTVPAWAKAENKPAYTAQEVGAMPADTSIPSKTSELTNDSDFITSAALEPYATNASLAEKANESELINYATKEDISTFITISALEPYATNASLEEKADVAYVDASLALKADESELEDYYTKEIVDASIQALQQRIIVMQNYIDDLEARIKPLEDYVLVRAEEERIANASLVNDIDSALENIQSGEIYTDPEGRYSIDASTSSSKYVLTILGDNELGDYTVPAEVNKAFTIEGNIKSGASIVSESTKTLTIINTTETHPNISIVSNGTVAMTGNFRDVEFDDGTLNGVNNEFANITGNVIISDNAAKATTINANFVGENNAIISNTSQNITINAKNEDANIDIECPNSTVVINGIYDDVVANVSDNTLKFNSIKTHIHTLNLKHGNIFINNGKNVINDLVDEIICDYEYTVDYNKATVLPNAPAACEYTLSQDKTGAVTWGTFATGNTVINLNGHTVHNAGTDGRPTMNIRNQAIVDINGEGTVSSDNEYAVWANGVETVTNINGGYYRGTDHAIYAYDGVIYINGGEFELNGNDYEKDAKGHAKFLINCYDDHFTAGTARIIVTGGRFHNFDPSDAWGEPTHPWSYLADDTYESVCVDVENQIFEVRKKS